jgi:hypothetical protein
MLRPILIIVGIVLAAFGGVIAYRAFFLEPSDVIVIADGRVRELPNYARVFGGSLLLISGFAIAFFAARRKR